MKETKDKVFGAVEVPADVNLRNTLDSFLKNYPLTLKKWEKTKILGDRFDISMLVMKKIFNLKHYDKLTLEEGETPLQAKDRGIQQLTDIMSTHLQFMLFDHVQ